MWVCICCSLLSSSAILWVRSCSWRFSPMVPSPPYQLAPPRALYALLSPSRSGVGLAPTLLLLGLLMGFCSPPVANQLSAQLVALPFGLFAPPALLSYPLLQRALRHLAAGSLGA